MAESGTSDISVIQTEPRGIVRFGVFELDLETQQLRKSGIRVRLQAKSCQVLEALLEKPGKIVSRDDLQRRLWPDEKFGAFDTGLNTAINRLRSALGDSADKPRYIETVARTGYRFVAPVLEHSSEAKADAAPTTAHADPAGAGSRNIYLLAAISLIVSITLFPCLSWRHPVDAHFCQIT